MVHVAKTLIVATHGHCFDGLASATLFTRLYRTLEPAGAPLLYRACDYGPNEGPLPSAWLEGAEAAILDYRFTASPAVRWYFDHHATAFASASDRAFYEARRGEGLAGAYDAGYSSCTKLIADRARSEYGVDFDDLAPLIAWADRIDTARFADADEAVRRDDPVLRLMTVIEQHGDDAFVRSFVPRLLERPVTEVAADADVRERYAPLAAARELAVARMRGAARRGGRVAVCDLADATCDVVEKFALYSFYPDVLYAVVLARTESKIKVSIGYNPWSGRRRAHDIGAICQRYGGGGHPVVGAIAFPLSALDRARALVNSVVTELEE